MDKLQPLIKHRYWICFAFALIFVLVGWWMASGAIALEIQARTASVEDSFKKAEQNKTDPNTFWVEQAKKKNEIDSSSYKSASTQLLQRQKEARQWPDVLKNELQGIAYRADVKDKTARARWASIYRDEIERLLEIVKPYKGGDGLVVVDSSKITHKPFNSWRTGPPASTEIWNCQEDIWLLRSLLTSIARVNEGATRITESQVRQIFKLTLRGGDRNATPGAAGGGMDSMMGSGMMPGEMGMGMGSGGGESGGGGVASYPGKEFEGSAGSDILTEEFGAFAATDGGNETGMAAMGMGSRGMGSMGMGSMGMGSVGMDGAGAAGPAEEKRYVDDGDELGYKTRAFLLDVIIRDDQIPNLLASLTNSDFPVEIVRVEVTSKSSSGQQGMGGSEMGSGMMSDMGMGMGRGGADETMAEPGFGMGSLDGGGLGIGATDSGYGGAGMQGMSSGMMPGGMMGVADKGKESLQIAMADPLLVHVKIGGLMTLYQSAQEADAEAATAETDQANAPAVVPPAEGAVEPGVDSGATEMSEPSSDSGDSTPASDATVKPEESATGDSPATEGDPSSSDSTPVPEDAKKDSEPAAEGAVESPSTSDSETPPPAETPN